MEWKTDADVDELEDQPYTSLKQSGGGRLMGRNPLPYIFMGIGIFVLIVLFVFFIPRMPSENTSDDAALLQQVDSMEQRIQVMEQYIKELRDSGGQQWMDPKNSVEYQQLLNWIKSNAEVISEVAKRTELLESQVKQAKLISVKPIAGSPAAVQKPAAAPPKTTKPEIVKAAAQPAVQKPAESQAAVYHEVKKGETLYGIAKNYSITVDSLREMNHLKDHAIQAGQKLVVKRP